VYGQVCETCKWLHKEHGRCNLPEHELVDLLECGYSSDQSCSKFQRDETLPPPEEKPRTEHEFKNRFDAWGMYEYVNETAYHDRLDELREQSRERED